MALTDEQKDSLKANIEEYDRLANSMFPMPSVVLATSLEIIKLLAIHAGVTLESED